MEKVRLGTLVSYEDVANPARFGRVAEINPRKEEGYTVMVAWSDGHSSGYSKSFLESYVGNPSSWQVGDEAPRNAAYLRDPSFYDEAPWSKEELEERAAWAESVTR